MALLEAAKAVVERWDTPSWKWEIHTAEFIQALRAAIAAEEAKTEDGAHSCGYHCQRPACVLAQRDELRAKLAATESAEPVAWMVDVSCVATNLYLTEADADDALRRDEKWRAENPGTTDKPWAKFPLYTHPSLPAYTPMTDDEFAEAEMAALNAWTPSRECPFEEWFGVIRRGIERAVLARLGVTQ